MAAPGPRQRGGEHHVTSSSHWSQWHSAYDDPSSSLRARLAVVRLRLRDAVAGCPPGPVRLLSLCAGQAHDVADLAGHPRAVDVTGRLVEADPDNARRAAGAVHAAGLAGLDVATGDASTTDAWAGAVPADVVLACGIFGNVSDDDVRTTVATLPQLCARGATVVWTRHRRRPDLTPAVRGWCTEAGFVEVAFDSAGPEGFAVGTARLLAEPLPFVPGIRMFTFR
jgi:hypothetical protein